MMLCTPAVLIPPEKPAIVRAYDLKGLPSWAEMQRREKAVKEATFPFPIFAPSGKPIVSYQTAAASTSALTTYSFTSLALGTAAPHRRIVVAVSGITTPSGAFSIVSATIGGVSATTVATRLSALDRLGVALIIADVPTGATGDVNVTFNTGMARAQVAVWAVYGLASATALATTGSAASPASLNINVAANNILIAAAITNASSTCTWTGVTENYDAVSDAQLYSGGSYAATASESPRTVTATYSAPDTNRAGVAAVWG